MKSIEEMTEIMLAYDRGEQIEQIHFYSKIWNKVKNPNWNWSDFDYRVKPHYIAFENADEVLSAMKKHGHIVRNKEKQVTDILSINEEYIIITNKINHSIFIDFESLFNDFEFDDGTPCGKIAK